MGDILRAEIASGSALGRSAQAVISRGGLLPDESLVDLMRNALEPLRGQSVIFDGYPRRPSQAQALDRMLEELDGAPVNLVVNLAVPDEVILARIQGASTA